MSAKKNLKASVIACAAMIMFVHGSEALARTTALTEDVEETANTVEDVLSVLSDGFTVPLSYSDHFAYEGISGAIYEGSCFVNKITSSIQMKYRQNEYVGIVVTKSPGYVRKVSATYNSNYSPTMNIYGKNTPYTSSSDNSKADDYGAGQLYSSDEAIIGEFLGSLVFNGKGDVQEIEIEGNYAYIGFMPDENSEALYLDDITVTWELADSDDNQAQTETDTFSIDSQEGYGTFYTDKAYIMPEGVKGATITTVNSNVLVIDWDYSAGETVPACTPLLLKRTDEETDYPKEFTYEITTSDASAPEQLLYGAVENTETYGPDDTKNYIYYKLTYDDNDTNIGFYYGAENGAAFESNAGRAWLAIENENAAASVKGFALEDNELTAVKSVESVAATNTIYNLQGIRVSNTDRKGIYIVNGKKVVTK